MKGRHDSVENNYAALRMLKGAGIYVYGSFVLGTEVETPATLEETVGWIKKIIVEGLLQDVEVQPILPLPNNYYGNSLIKEGLWNPTIDWPRNTDEISQSYINNFSGVSYQDVLHAAKEVRDFAKKHSINYGSGVSKEERYS